MKLDVLCTAQGLVPVGDDSYEEKRKLRVGQIYQCEVKVPRNYQFLKKAHALINASWELLPERTRAGFRENKEMWRRYVTVASGYVDVFFSPKIRDYVEMPRSWSFGSMDEAEFSELYERMKDVIFSVIGKYITPEQFEATLLNF